MLRSPAARSSLRLCAVTQSVRTVFMDKGLESWKVSAAAPQGDGRRADDAPPPGYDNTQFPHYPETSTETRIPGISPPVSHLRYMKYTREPPPTDDPCNPDPALGMVHPSGSLGDGLHPHYDYVNRSGKKNMYGDFASTADQWRIKLAVCTLYKACLNGMPLVKNFYWLQVSYETMKKRIRSRFEMNRHITDPNCSRQLLQMGWNEYEDTITFRKTKGSMQRYFSDRDEHFVAQDAYVTEEIRMLDHKAYYEGEEQKADGSYEGGQWSVNGVNTARQWRDLAGRTPMSIEAGKGYFEPFKSDGTNYWERNMDYEGWYMKNMDPDGLAARREASAFTDQGYNQPRHYASKNRRSYRRMVREVENIMTASTHENYAQSRELMYQAFIREGCPEANRIHAEKKLAKFDDEALTTKFDEMDKINHQVIREFPNPRMWKTDAFYLRHRYLMNKLEFNWAKAPIGMELEKHYNNWISDDVNYTVCNSEVFQSIWTCKKRNPMAKSWNDFFREFDPDKPETRRLPWYHKDFDYDRRYKWDEKCMRQKKWIDSGDIDFTRNFFDAMVHEWQQWVNRPEIMKHPDSCHKKYTAPRIVQLYRSLNKRMEVALVNQMVKAMGPKVKTVADAEKALASTDWSKFTFDVPAVIYPDDYEQPPLATDGTPLSVKAAE